MMAETTFLLADTSPVTMVLIAAGAACGLMIALAVVLLVAERFLANYGECSVDINDGRKKLTVTGGESLLATLKGQGIFIPSACGGRGTCSFCKLKILDGGGPITPTEQPLLDEQEIADNVRISCQVKVRNDIRIRVPEELFSIREYRGTVERIRDLTHDIKELRIRLVEPETIEFRPGQYVQLEAPAYGDNPDPVYRAYSVASSPDETDSIELIVRRVPGGICTTWVFEHLEEGQEVRFNGPYGEFRLSDADGKPMIWIAGGSGMAPFWSIVRYMKAHDIARPCRYFFGAVAPRDLFLVEELNQLAKELDWFEFIPALSGQDLPDWDGEKGLITAVVDRHVKEDPEQEGYLCGSAGMIDAAVKVLKAKGIPEASIFYDKFN